VRLPERMDGQVRIGVALLIPAPFGSLLQEARASFGDESAHQIPPHVTLLGPTVIDSTKMGKVNAHLSRVGRAHEPFVMRLRGTGTFRPVSEVAFVDVVEGVSDCERLERSVRSGPLRQQARFAYHPHVTVAHDVPDVALDLALGKLSDFDVRFDVTSLQVFEHGDDGVWRPVRDFPLGTV
jgi:2'-5' RNA ligase